MIRIFSNSAYKNSFKNLQFVHNNPQPSQKMPILGMHFSKHIIELKFLQLPPILYLPSFFSQGGVCEFCREMTSSFWFKHILYKHQWVKTSPQVKASVRWKVQYQFFAVFLVMKKFPIFFSNALDNWIMRRRLNTYWQCR